MRHLKPWSDFLKRQIKAPPLRYVNGMRHPVSQGASCAVHFHPCLEIVYHPTGCGVTRVAERESVAFCEGSAVIYVPNEPHDQLMDAKGEDLCVQIDVPETVLSASCLYVPMVENASALEDLRLLSRGQLRPRPVEQVIYDLRATALLLGLVQSACDFHQRDQADLAERHILKAEQYIRECYPSIGSVADVARHVEVSQDYLRHIFKRLRGKPLVRHLCEVRIERAKMLLRHSRLPMKQIASLCGFKDEYYFSAVFRRIVCTTPGAYRMADVTPATPALPPA